MASAALPPLPAGYRLDAPSPQAGLPPLPPGYQLDSSAGLPSGVTKPHIDMEQVATPSSVARQLAGVAVGAFTGSPGAVSTGEMSGSNSGSDTTQGLSEIANPGTRLKGAVKLIGAGADLATPLVGAAAVESPAATLRTLVGGSAGQAGAQKSAELLGADPDQVNAAGIAGGVLGGAAAAGAPLAKGLIPSAERAAESFQAVSKVAGQHTVPITDGLSSALAKYQELVDAGGSRSMAVNKLIQRVTDPEKPPLTYDEARLFSSNISRLSADDSMRLTPVMKRAVGQIASEFNGAISDTANNAGKLDTYMSAMSEYRRAMALKDVVNDAKTAAVKYGGRAVAGGAGAYAAKKLILDQ